MSDASSTDDDHDLASEGAANRPLPDAASGDGDLEWVVEAISSAACQARACELSKAIKQIELWEDEIAKFVQSTAKLLNAPEAYISHQISPMVGSACRNVRSSRWSTNDGSGHVDAMCFTKVLGGGSGTGKSQTQTAMLNQYSKYQTVVGRDLLVRNATPEALETRMFTNSLREEQLVTNGDAGEGAILIVFDEGNKLVAMGQYKKGATDHKERWMEASNGALVVTDRKDGSTKMTKGASAAGSKKSGSDTTSSSPSDFADSPLSSGSPPASNADADDDETFTSKLSTEKYYAHLCAIMYTHVWRVYQWAHAEASGEGTDGWMARLKCVVIDEERKASGRRADLMDLAEDPEGNKTMQWPFYHVLVGVDIICRLLPAPNNGLCWKLLELDDDCEEGFVAWEAEVMALFKKLKGAPPSAELVKVVHSKSLGDLIKESGISALLRISVSALRADFESESSLLRGYAGYEFDKFHHAMAPHIQTIIDNATKNAKTNYPQVINMSDMEKAKKRVTWEVETALALIPNPKLESSIAKPVGGISSGKEGISASSASASSGKDQDKNKGRHDLGPLRKNESFFKLPLEVGAKRSAGPKVDKLAYFMHLLLTTPRISHSTISASMLANAELKGTPRIYLDKGGVFTVYQLVEELGKRGLATLHKETPQKKDVDMCAKLHKLKNGQARVYIKVVNLEGKPPSELETYKAALSGFALTPANLMHMNKDTLPPMDYVKYLPLESLKLLVTSADVSKSAGVAEALLSGAGPPDKGDDKGAKGAEEDDEDDEPSDLALASQHEMSAADEAMMPPAPKTPPRPVVANKRTRDSPGQAGPVHPTISGAMDTDAGDAGGAGNADA